MDAPFHSSASIPEPSLCASGFVPRERRRAASPLAHTSGGRNGSAHGAAMVPRWGKQRRAGLPPYSQAFGCCNFAERRVLEWKHYVAGGPRYFSDPRGRHFPGNANWDLRGWRSTACAFTQARVGRAAPTDPSQHHPRPSGRPPRLTHTTRSTRGSGPGQLKVNQALSRRSIMAALRSGLSLQCGKLATMWSTVQDADRL